MTKKKRSLNLGGPYVATAVFCEKVLKEPDGVLSLIRIVDTWKVQAERQADGLVPSEMPPVQVHAFLVIALKAGDFRGDHRLQVTQIGPDRQLMQTMDFPCSFEGYERGTATVVDFRTVVKDSGLYWFEISLPGVGLLTKVPMRIAFQAPPRVQTASGR